MILFREVFVSPRACGNFGRQSRLLKVTKPGKVEDHRPDGRHRRAVPGTGLKYYEVGHPPWSVSQPAARSSSWSIWRRSWAWC